jgi:hypothetical protein
MVYRVVLASNFQISAHEVRLRWALRDLIEAHVMLDHVDENRPKPPPQEGVHGR